MILLILQETSFAVSATFEQASNTLQNYPDVTSLTSQTIQFCLLITPRTKDKDKHTSFMLEDQASI